MRIIINILKLLKDTETNNKFDNAVDVLLIILLTSLIPSFILSFNYPLLININISCWAILIVIYIINEFYKSIIGSDRRR
jgi:hypothetical protein